RGGPAHFPALLEPLLAAPFQALFSPETAYRLTQAENALLMSLAAVPVYLLARRLQLSAGYGLACAAFAVLIPDLVYASYTLPVLGGLAVGASRVFGYYSHVAHFHVGGALVHWAGTDLFLLAVASGIVLVPGALVGLARPRGRGEAAFTAIVATFGAGLLLEA